jgi:ABC-type nickel/cobalt efflux system permease component RcnA
MEPWVIRGLFIVLAMAGGLGILIYLILYVVLPEAKTTAQKIEMKGDPVNIHNIKEAVKKEFESVKKSMKL